MNSFKIGDTEFGIGDVQLSIGDGLINLEITGSEEIFNELTENDECRWSWALYPPKIYFRNVPFDNEAIIVDEEFLDQWDIALYMMEHNDFIGTLEVTDKNIHISGQAGIMGEISAVSINAERAWRQSVIHTA